jgi:hypothetical protein
MALDPNARKVALNFPGGTLTASRGLLSALFGPNLTGAGASGDPITVSVGGHTRTRVIGGDSISVSGTSYVRKKYPVSVAGGAAGGEAIKILVSGKDWTARLSGSHQALNDFLAGSSFFLDEAAFWQSEKGTKYGPFTTSGL